MKVILIQDVPNLGRVDEIKEVADGYARNFLFAQNLAVPASKQKLDELQAKSGKQKRQAETDLREQQRLASQLDGLELHLKERASKQGTFYAAMGPAKIANALKKMDLIVRKDQVMTEPLKGPGEYKIKIKLGHGLEAYITVTVSAA